MWGAAFAIVDVDAGHEIGGDSVHCVCVLFAVLVNETLIRYHNEFIKNNHGVNISLSSKGVHPGEKRHAAPRLSLSHTHTHTPHYNVALLCLFSPYFFKKPRNIQSVRSFWSCSEEAGTLDTPSHARSGPCACGSCPRTWS